jgi:transposase
MSRKEAPREGLLKAALAGKVTNAEVARALGLTRRQVQRLKRRYEAAGAAGLLHGLRGRASPRRVPEAVRTQVAALLRGPWADVNDCHAADQLAGQAGLAVSRRTLQRLRVGLGLPSKHRRRGRQYRRRRLRAAQAGTLVQVDASQFAWLEERGPMLTLHRAIDDATGEVLALHFRATEDLHGYVAMLHDMARHRGLPVTLYGDRLNVFVRNDRHWTLAEELAGQQTPTHFGQILQALGIGFIAAGSPQAKGRIERLWQTLQDRLVVELRWAGITTAGAANAWLPSFLARFNPRFSRPARVPAGAWRRPPADLALQLGCRYPRTVARDNNVRVGLRWVQLRPRAPQQGWAGARVEVRELLDGRLVVFHQERLIATAAAPVTAFTLAPRRSPQLARARRRRLPPAGPSAPSPRGGHRAKRRLSRSPRARWSPKSRPAATHPWRTPRRARSAPSPVTTSRG